MKKIYLLVFVLISSLQIQAQCDDLMATFSSDSLFCAGASFDFESTSQFTSGSLATFMWTATSPNVTISNDATPTTSIEFTQQGLYEITLTVEDDFGCSDSFTKEVLVQNAVANFTTNQTGLLCGPLEVTIENLQNNNATNYLWHIEEETILGNINNYYDDTSGVVLTHLFNNPAMSAVELIVESAYSCYDTLRIDSFIHVSFPLPAFTISPFMGCDSTIVTVTDNSTLVDDYQFDWAADVTPGYNLGEANSRMYTYDYTEIMDGPQLIYLTLHAETDGCLRSYPSPFILNPDPVIHMDVSDTITCQNIDLSFYDNSTHMSNGVGVNFFWDFGDGQTSYLQNPNHAYSIPGLYTIYHSVASPLGCSSDTTWSQQIEVLESPEALFTYSNTILCFGASEIQFENTSVDVTDSLSLLWTFGDDSFINSNPSYQYYQTNLYPVKLLVTDQNLCKDSVTYQVGVDVIADEVNLGFTHESMICAGATFEFTRNIGLELETETYYSWSSSSDSVNIIDSTLATAIVSFDKEGVFPLTLTIWNEFGCWGTATQMVEVKNAHADFSTSQIGQLCGPLDVTIVNLQNDNATNYQWNISENTLAGEINNYTVETENDSLVYNFTNPALSDIELIVESAYSCYDTLRIDALVDVFFPIPQFSINKVVGCDSVYLEITDESFLVDTFSFDFGNNDSIDYVLGETNTSLYTYDYTNVSGNGEGFLLTLNAEGACPKNYDKLFLLNPEPLIVIEASDYSGCPPFEIEFSDSSLFANLDACTYYWDFGDGNTSTDQNPVHEYLESGIFTITHSITTPNDCVSDTIWEQEIEIYQLPEASFTYTNAVVCFGAAELLFEDISTDYTDSLLLTWSIEDSTFTQSNPSYQFYITDTYSVNLSIEDQHQCIDDTTIYIDVEVIAEDVSVSFNHAPMICSGIGSVFEFTPNPALYLDGVETDISWSSTSTVVLIENLIDSIGLISFTEEGIFPLTITVSNESGCTEEGTQMVEVKNAHADFSTSQIGQLCGPLDVTIVNLQNDNATNYQWNISEKTLAGAINNYTVETENDTLVYNFTNPALSDIELIVESAYSCYDTLTIENLVDVFFPIPQFSVSQFVGCDSVYLEITDESFLVDTFSFDFGNNDSIDYVLGETNTSLYTYDYTNVSGNGEGFSITLNAVTSACPKSYNESFLLYPEPLIVIDASDYKGCPPFEIEFSDSSLFANLDACTYYWDFGDGYTSTEQNPVHEYLESGIFTIAHSITTPNDCVSDTIWEQEIEIYQLPDASFTYTNQILCFGAAELEFQDTSTDYTDSLLLTWSIEDSVFTQPNPSYQYYVTDTYEVNLYVVDQHKCFDDTTVFVDVEVIAENVSVLFSQAEMICSGVGAEFDFTPNPALYLEGVETQFVWSSTSPIVVIDDSISDVASVSFTQEGLFPLTMLISNETGCLEEVTQMVEVKNAHADFTTAQLGELCGPLDVNITNFQNDNATNYQWNITEHTLLGAIINNTVDTEDSVLTYFFNNPALSDVELIVESAYSCYDTLKIDTLINVFFPLPNFVINPIDGCDSIVLEITDQSNFVDYLDFDFGNGVNGEYLLNETNSMLYTFDYDNGTDAAQVFTLSMLAVTNTCPTIFSKEFTLYPNPKIQIGVTASTGCPPFDMTFFDQSLFIDTLESTYFWNFGDGFTSTKRNPDHTYLNTGLYTVIHSVTTPNGCESDTVWETQIEVYEMPEASFTHLNPTLCFGSSHLQFNDISYDPTNELAYQWTFADVGMSTDQNPLQEFLQTTTYEVNLQVQDQHFCLDDTTMFIEVNLLDTFVVKPVINYVSIEDEVVEVKWAYTPDFYFDNLSLYHQDYNNPWSLIYNTETYFPGEFLHDILPINEQNEYHLIQQDSCTYYSEPSELHSTILLTPVSTSPQVVTLNWTAYIGWEEVETYGVYRSLEDEEFEYVGKVEGDVLTYQDSSLCNTVYSYYVVANDLNSSFKSKSNKAWIIPEFIDFTIPLLLKYTSVSQNDKIYTQWNTHYPSEMTYYKIDRWDDYFGWIENYAYAAEPPFVDGDVGVDHRKYVYKISYADVCGNEGPKGRIGTNVLLEASQFESHYELSWNEYDDWIGDVSEHLIQYFNNDLNAYQNIATVSGSTFSYTDSDLDKSGIDTSYCYRVIAQSAENNDYRSISNVQCFVPQPKDYFPNAFSPNNDGLNEVYKFEGNFAKEMNVEIYDYWGNIVFSSDVVDFEWDGLNQNSGEACPQGVYVFRFEITGFENTFMKNEMNIYIVK